MRKNIKTTVTTAMLAIAMMLSLTACGSKNTDNQGSAADAGNTSVSVVTEIPSSDNNSAAVTNTDTVILTDGGFSITFTGAEPDNAKGFALNFKASNTTSELKACSFGKVYVDGICIYPSVSSAMKAQPGEDVVGTYAFNADVLAQLGITDLSSVDVSFVYTNAAGETVVSDLISVETGVAASAPNNYNTENQGFCTVYDKNGILIQAKYVRSTKNIIAVMENTTSENAVTSCAVTALNGVYFPEHYCGSAVYEYFAAGEQVVGVFNVYDAALGLTAPIESVTLDVTVNDEAFTIDIPVEE